MSSDTDRLRIALPGYDIGAQVGRGGCGVVLAGTHRRLGRPVAIKQIPPHFAHDEHVRRRFVAEARLLAAIDHPHVVRVFDYVEDDELCLLVMEYLPGGTVGSKFATEGFDAATAVAVGLACAAGLEAAHRHRILHRDVKPSNLMFGTGGAIKLTDFGIAKIVGGDETLVTRTGEIVGTPSYIAPEQARGQPLTPATDVYALATMLYQLLSGVLPFPPNEDHLATLFAHAFGDPVPLTDVAPAVPDLIAEVVMRGLATDPAERFDTAESFGIALAEPAADCWGGDWLTPIGIPVIGAATIVAAATGSSRTTARRLGEMTPSSADPASRWRTAAVDSPTFAPAPRTGPGMPVAPPTGTTLPPAGTTLPPAGTTLPPVGTMPLSAGAALPPTGTTLPPGPTTTAGTTPSAGTTLPGGATVPSTTGAPPSAGGAPPSAGGAPPSAGGAPPSAGGAPPSAGGAPPSAGGAPPPRLGTTLPPNGMPPSPSPGFPESPNGPDATPTEDGFNPLGISARPYGAPGGPIPPPGATPSRVPPAPHGTGESFGEGAGPQWDEPVTPGGRTWEPDEANPAPPGAMPPGRVWRSAAPSPFTSPPRHPMPRVRPVNGLQDKGVRLVDVDRRELVPIREVVVLRSPRVPFAFAAVLAVAACGVALVGLGAQSGGDLPPGAVTVAGADPAVVNSIEVDLGAPIAMQVNGIDADAVALTVEVLGNRLGADPVPLVRGEQGGTATVSAPVNPHMLAGTLDGKVALLRDGTEIATHRVELRTTQPAAMTALAVAIVVVALFAGAYLESNMRALRRGRGGFANSAGLVVSSAIGAVAVVGAVWILLDRPPTVTTLIVGAVLAGAAGLATSVGARRMGKRYRYLRRARRRAVR
ncbi:serine/threonine-protein kinase [Nocardia sp. GCM10030253]|uniref:serine/threonine-protein kinase n=1 Tax=Nocardia sp. GCM10030253 TaxID=3273404 RepID=UPI0036351F3A